jgi:hypothetical protein
VVRLLEAGMRGLVRKDTWKAFRDGELETEVAAWSAASGAPATPRNPIDLDDARGARFERRLGPELVLPGVSRPGAGSAVAPSGPAWAGHSEALELLAIGASGLLDWRRKREASPRA